MTLRIVVHGAAGRMGAALVGVVRSEADLELAAAIEHDGHPDLGTDAGIVAGGASMGVALAALGDGLPEADVCVDFSTPDGTARLVAACATRKLPAVVGTTGLAAPADAALAKLAVVAPVVVAANTSVGVTVLLHLASRAAALLGDGYDAEIVEMHHRHKVDAPSGTAARLAEVVSDARGFPADAVTHGRSGAVGARPERQVGVMSLRGGDVVGEHTLVFAGEGERIELGHRAQSRSLFARGALRAARWVVAQAPGRYDMADVIGLE